MNKKDILWGVFLLSVASFLIYPETSKLFIAATKEHPYLMGFIKVSVLASMGELLAIRIAKGDYKKPAGFIYRFIIWGFIGMSFVLVFDLFASGVAGAMNKGLLPALDNETVFGKLKEIVKVQLADVVKAIDWNRYITFVVVKTIPLFWIPAHTVTFMLPGEYRVLVAAMLSVALGGILAFSKKQTIHRIIQV